MSIGLQGQVNEIIYNAFLRMLASAHRLIDSWDRHFQERRGLHELIAVNQAVKSRCCIS